MAEQPKLTGPEMMIRSILRAMGVNPQEIVGMMTTVIGEMQGGLATTVKTMLEIQAEQKSQRVLLEALCRELKIPVPDTGAHHANGVGSAEILPPLSQ